MPEVGFELILDEVESADSVEVMPVLVRSSLLHGADNRPEIAIITDKVLYFGGSRARGGQFKRIPLNSVVASSKAGVLLWECVRLTHMELDGERTVYLCPFTGSPSLPRKDQESMGLLLGRLRRD